MTSVLIRVSALAAALASVASGLPAQKAPPVNDGPANKYGNTLVRAPRPTAAPITVDDLKTRLYIFADDSMQGRQQGREGNMKGTAYIARELARLGLEPAGDNGTYFQGLPYFMRYYTSESQLTAGGRTLRFATDFLPVPAAGRQAIQEFSETQVIYGGLANDTTYQISAAQAAGRIVVLTTTMTAATQRLVAARARAADSAAAANPGAAVPVRVSGNLQINDQTVAVLTQGANAQAAADSVRAAVAAALANAGRGGRAGGRGAGGGRGGAAGRGGGRGGGGRGGGRGGAATTGRFTAAAAIVTIDLDSLSEVQRANLTNPTQATYTPGATAPAGPGAVLGAAPAVVTIRVSTSAASALMGVPMDSLVPGAAGVKVSGRLHFVDKYTPEFGRNVVAIVRGSDPTLRDEFVSIGAHNDHTGYTPGTWVDHDSLKAFNDALMKLTIRGRDTLLPVTPDIRTQVRVNMDSLRRVKPTVRRDSVRNGADDDGSGSMAVLEIAEAIAMMPVKPRRSVLFIWHTAEESGLNGSAYYAANPTVPREQIVANINMDMVGRGRPEDLPGGGTDYVAVVGADRLSTDLGRMVEDVNKAQRRPLQLDYRFDAPTPWGPYNNIYGRSDHANYARYGIPIAFFFTGLHGDYHQLTDEPQYINYPLYNRIANYVRDLVLQVGNAAARPRVDRPGQQ